MNSLRIGFLGVGWIGRNRLEAALATGHIASVAICDPSPDCRQAAVELAPGAAVMDNYEELLRWQPDGIVVATPSALHAAQAIRALEHGAAVFCQKPIGRSAADVRRVVEAARRADRLFAADFSYRRTRGLQAIKRRIAEGAFGAMFAVDLTFHNAYGPDKDWFYDPAQSGGGCLMDLGSHLIDAASWLMDADKPLDVRSADLLTGGAETDGRTTVEDYAVAQLHLGHVAVRLACSWRLHAGQDAAIEVAVYGTEGGARFKNVDGSFYDFEAEFFRGTARERLVAPPDAWGGRAVAAWVQAAADGLAFRPNEIATYVSVAATLDDIYACHARTRIRAADHTRPGALARV